MNIRPTLESLNLELLGALQRDWQAEMRQEARKAYLLRDQTPNGNEGKARFRWKLVMALEGAVLLVLGFARFVGQ